MKQIENYIMSKIEECFNTSDASLLYADPNNINLFLPKIAIDNLINHFNDKIYLSKLPMYEIGNTLKYRGVNVLLGYEMAIIIAHIDAPLHQHLINKINL